MAKFANHHVGTCLWHVSMAISIVSTHWKHAKGMSLRYGVYFYTLPCDGERDFLELEVEVV